MSTSTYPHRRSYVDPPGAYRCAECGYTTTDRSGHPASVGFGSDCPAAMRERIGELERERDEMAEAGRTVVECAEEEWATLDAHLTAKIEELDEYRRYVAGVEAERDEARTTALREAGAVLRMLADGYLAAHGGGGDYCRALYDAAGRIEVLTTDSATAASRYSAASDAGIARESEPAPPATTIDDVEGDL